MKNFVSTKCEKNDLLVPGFWEMMGGGVWFAA